ncbi:MAG: hypothetical protein JNM52_10495, partial [Betaproteobacteria bacterium]|nr:hypothetical protein [Betaproteobacteria bacterium]
TWVNLNNSLGITQFYGGAGKRAAGGKVIGGTQDNGTLVLNSGTNWARFAGGDGGYVAVDPVDDNTLYGEYIYASIHRTVDFNQRQYICTGITEGFATTGGISYCGPNGTQEANFISPFILDPNNRERMLVGANSLWASNNVKDPNPTWSAIKAPDAPGSARQFINSIAVYERDSNIIWVGHNSPGALWKTVNGLSATPTWQRVGQGVLPTSTINRVTIDPDNPNRVWVAYTGFATNRLWQTTDGGTTWRSITANLPAITLHDIKRHPTQTNWLYVAAANGVYTSENGGQSWSTNNDGPAGVRVRELFWYDSTTLIAATYGRGMFSITAAAPAGPLNYSDMWWGGNAENGWGMSIQQHESNVQFNALYVYDNQGLPRWYVMPGGTWNPGFTSYTGLLYQPTSSPFSAYNANQLVVGPSVGNLTINDTSSTATINYTINGVSAQKSIMRQVFGSGTAPFDANDLWWGGSVNAAEGGWGVNIAQQQGTLFVVWYTYGADGRVKWFVMPGGNWSGNSYTGMLYETTSSAWLGVAYNPAALQVLPVGSMTLDFAGISNGRATTATMTYTVNGLTQSKAITRQAF